MIVQFFTSNDNNRLFVAFGLLILLQIPFWNQEAYLDPSIFKWVFIANHISLAPFYTDLWDNSSPFIANIYAFTQGVFNTSPLGSQILGIILVCFQAYIFNKKLNQYDLFDKRSLLPALLYVLFVSLPSNSFFISSALVSQTFIILFFTTFLSFHQKQLTASHLFLAGIYLGLAILCHSFWVLLLPILPFFIYIFSNRFSLVYICFGVSLPIATLSIFYAFYDVSDLFFSQYFLYNLTSPKLFLTSLSWVHFSFFIMVCVSFLVLLFKGRYAFLQQSTQKAVFVWYAFAALICYLYSDIASDFFRLTAAPQAIIMTYFVYWISKNLYRSIYLLSLLTVVLILTYSIFFTQEIAAKNNFSQMTASKRSLLWLGNSNTEVYRNNQLYAPFIHWEVAKPIFQKLNTENAVRIYQYFSLENPNIIIDTEGVIPEIFKRFPSLERRYLFQAPNEYRLIYPISLPAQQLPK